MRTVSLLKPSSSTRSIIERSAASPCLSKVPHYETHRTAYPTRTQNVLVSPYTLSEASIITSCGGRISSSNVQEYVKTQLYQQYPNQDLLCMSTSASLTCTEEVQVHQESNSNQLKCRPCKVATRRPKGNLSWSCHLRFYGSTFHWSACNDMSKYKVPNRITLNRSTCSPFPKGTGKP